MPEPFSVPVLSAVEPSLKVTVPVGVLEPLVVTVAVKVTACPKLDGLSEETSAVVVATPLVLIRTPTVPLLQLLALTQLFATNRSGLSSPFTSATAVDQLPYPPEP